MNTNNNSICIDANIFNIDVAEAKSSLSYSCKDFISELLCLHKFKHKWWERIRSRIQLFHQHVDSFKSETDWLHIVSSIRELQNLKKNVKNVIEQNRLVLESYQQSRYLDSSEHFEPNFNSQSRLRFSVKYKNVIELNMNRKNILFESKILIL